MVYCKDCKHFLGDIAGGRQDRPRCGHPSNVVVSYVDRWYTPDNKVTKYQEDPWHLNRNNACDKYDPKAPKDPIVRTQDGVPTVPLYDVYD